MLLIAAHCPLTRDRGHLRIAKHHLDPGACPSGRCQCVGVGESNTFALQPSALLASRNTPGEHSQVAALPWSLGVWLSAPHNRPLLAMVPMYTARAATA